VLRCAASSDHNDELPLVLLCWRVMAMFNTFALGLLDVTLLRGGG
jgi:hypothetical protein